MEEATWIDKELENTKIKNFGIIAGVNLLDEDLLEHVRALKGTSNRFRGVRQVLNYEPNW